MVYKWCVVPNCINTSIKTPEKLFVNVPRHAKARRKWLLLAHRDPNDIGVESQVFFCEDHFDMETDIANYYQYKMGFSKRLLLAEGALPSKFHCQEDLIKKKWKRRRNKMARDFVRKRCAKCNITAAEDRSLNFHRFPLPGKYGMSRTWAWAKYCYPDGDWSTEKSLQELHFQQKMICSKHFDKSCYTTGSKKRLNIFAIPSDVPDSVMLQLDQSLSKAKNDTEISVDKSQLGLKNNTDLIQRNSNSDEGISLEANFPTIIEEAEMDVHGTSIASTSMSNTNTASEYKTKVTAAQTSVLCNFFEENPEVVRGYSRSPKCLEDVQNKWKKITPHLNSVGPPRDHRSWAKYLCGIKASLKKKSIKWRQSCDGKDPTICNAEDFNELKLRMLQVLRKDVSDTQESQDSHTPEETENDSNYHDNLNEGYNYNMEISPDIQPKLEYLEQNVEVINHDTPSPDLQHQVSFEDEFYYFGKNVAQQLRTLPLLVALETQEMLLAVLTKQRLKALHSTDPLKKEVL